MGPDFKGMSNRNELRLQVVGAHNGSFVRRRREYFHFFGLDYDKLNSRTRRVIMIPGDRTRGEIGPARSPTHRPQSLIGIRSRRVVAVRNGVLELSRPKPSNRPSLQ